MRRRPRPADESVLGAGLGRAALATGALIAVCTLTVGVGSAHLSLPWQTMAFLVLGFAQLGVALAVRAHRRRGQRSPWLVAAVALSALLLVAAVIVPVLRDLLGTEPVTPAQFVAAVGVATIPGLVVYLPQLRAQTRAATRGTGGAPARRRVWRVTVDRRHATEGPDRGGSYGPNGRSSAGQR
jgi:Ca2+-transporting ATPase